MPTKVGTPTITWTPEKLAISVKAGMSGAVWKVATARTLATAGTPGMSTTVRTMQ
jgi:hypothetical protein